MSESGDRRREQTRARIVQEAGRLFGRLGFHSTQVMDIVRAVGMSAGTFYNHFEDKRDLFEVVASENFEALRARLRGLREPLGEAEPEERRAQLAASFEALFDYVEASPEQVLVLLRGGLGPDSDLAAWSYALSMGQEIASDFRRWRGEAEGSEVGSLLLSHAVVGMAMQVVHSYLVERAFTRGEAVESLVRMTWAVLESARAE